MRLIDSVMVSSRFEISDQARPGENLVAVLEALAYTMNHPGGKALPDIYQYAVLDANQTTASGLVVRRAVPDLTGWCGEVWRRGTAVQVTITVVQQPVQSRRSSMFTTSIDVPDEPVMLATERIRRDATQRRRTRAIDLAYLAEMYSMGSNVIEMHTQTREASNAWAAVLNATHPLPYGWITDLPTPGALEVRYPHLRLLELLLSGRGGYSAFHGSYSDRL